jgi:hypothetical protein
MDEDFLISCITAASSKQNHRYEFHHFILVYCRHYVSNVIPGSMQYVLANLTIIHISILPLNNNYSLVLVPIILL